MDYLTGLGHNTINAILDIGTFVYLRFKLITYRIYTNRLRNPTPVKGASVSVYFPYRYVFVYQGVTHISIYALSRVISVRMYLYSLP